MKDTISGVAATNTIVHVLIFATDAFFASASCGFTIVVGADPNNEAPEAVGTIPNQVAAVNVYFEYALTETPFTGTKTITESLIFNKMLMEMNCLTVLLSRMAQDPLVSCPFRP